MSFIIVSTLRTKRN